MKNFNIMIICLNLTGVNHLNLTTSLRSRLAWPYFAGRRIIWCRVEMFWDFAPPSQTVSSLRRSHGRNLITLTLSMQKILIHCSMIESFKFYKTLWQWIHKVMFLLIKLLFLFLSFVQSSTNCLGTKNKLHFLIFVNYIVEDASGNNSFLTDS